MASFDPLDILSGAKHGSQTRPSKPKLQPPAKSKPVISSTSNVPIQKSLLTLPNSSKKSKDGKAFGSAMSSKVKPSSNNRPSNSHSSKPPPSGMSFSDMMNMAKANINGSSTPAPSSSLSTANPTSNPTNYPVKKPIPNTTKPSMPVNGDRKANSSSSTSLKNNKTSTSHENTVSNLPKKSNPAVQSSLPKRPKIGESSTQHRPLLSSSMPKQKPPIPKTSHNPIRKPPPVPVKPVKDERKSNTPGDKPPGYPTSKPRLPMKNAKVPVKNQPEPRVNKAPAAPPAPPPKPEPAKGPAWLNYFKKNRDSNPKPARAGSAQSSSMSRHGSSHQYGSSNPRKRVYDDYDDEEDDYDDDLDDFIDDGEEELDYRQRSELKKVLTTFCRSDEVTWKRRERDVDLSKMHSNFHSIDAEEKRSSRIARIEDMVEESRGSRTLS